MARDDTPAFCSSSPRSTKRSIKLPDPLLFTDGTEPTWDGWQGKIRDKLEINSDHFDNDRAVLAYIHSRTDVNEVH